MKIYLCLLILCIGMYLHTAAQTKPAALTAHIRQEVTDSLAKSLLKNYVFRDTALRMGSYIKKRLREKAYDSISDPYAFAQTLTMDLRTVYPDFHLAIQFNPQLEKMVRDNSGHDNSSVEEGKKQARQRNFGFKKAELLNANIGYLSFEAFFDVTDEAKSTVSGVFAFLQHSNALIIDLRYNSGGDPEMVKYLCSHFLKAKTHINDLYERRLNKTHAYVTDSLDNPAAFYTIPVYILTSGRTFSAAEEFAYDMQSQHRAVIVGATTGGGAHPVGPEIISNGFIGNIPYARAINPVTRTNWEGVGVKPDVKTNADSALDAAVMLYYNERISHSPDTSEVRSFKWARDMLVARLHPFSVDTESLKSYTGNFGAKRALIFHDGALYYANAIGLQTKLIPLSATTFKPEGNDHMKIKISKDAAGTVDKVYLIYDDGSGAVNARSK